MRVKDCRSGLIVGFFGSHRENPPRTQARCIDLLTSPALGSILGPKLVRRAALPVRLIHHLEDLSPEAILVSDSLECSVEDCLRLSSSGTGVVILAMLPTTDQELCYARSGAAAYLNLTVDDRLVFALDAIGAELSRAARCYV